MRARVIGIVVVVGLGIVGITLAQQPGTQLKSLAPDRAALRSQAVKLHVEVELLQLDHDADREVLFAWLKIERTGTGGLSGLAIETMLAAMGNPEATKIAEEGAKLIAQAKEKGEDEEAMSKRVMASALKAQIDAMKKSYAKLAAELADKRLQLEAVDKQYHKAE